MIGFLIFLHTIVCLFLIIVVLMQASQGGGLSGTFGGQAASSVLGGHGWKRSEQITSWLATFLLHLVVISFLSGPSDVSSNSLVKKAAEDRPLTPSTEALPETKDQEIKLDLEEK